MRRPHGVIYPHEARSVSGTDKARYMRNGSTAAQDSVTYPEKPMFRPWTLFAIAAIIFLTACADDVHEDVETPEDTNGGDDSNDTPDVREDVPEVTDIPTTCNGHAELCDRPFDTVVFPATHNSMSNTDEGWAVPNQTYGLERQLEDGVRAFLLDVYLYKGELHLCHSSCILGKRSFEDAMWAFRDFLRTHRGEVITFILEDHVDGATIVQGLKDMGLDDWVYDGHDNDAWPTLRTLIDDNTRLIVTAENGGSGDGTPSWYVNAWEVMFDNPYSNEGVEDFSCVLNRGETSHSLYLLNHWLSDPISKPELAEVANTKEVLLDHAQACEEEHGQSPNFVAIDHYSIGDLFEVVRILNGLDN